jgi:DNA gyrase subunit B
MQGPSLEQLAKEYQIFRALVARLATRHDPIFLEELLNVAPFSDLERSDAAALDRWTTMLTKRMRLKAGPACNFIVTSTVESDVEHPGLKVVRLVHGIPETRYLSFDFFSSADYLRIADLSKKLDGLVAPDGRVERGERETNVTSFGQAYEWLLGEARRGYHIQRYKGLGEMNPAQLWETTMDPETRRLLRVAIEDAVAADQIFTTLMGEQVEPRRDFIERNALEAENIDV